MNRRQFLEGLTGVGCVVAAGCALDTDDGPGETSPSDESERATSAGSDRAQMEPLPELEFDRVLHAVNDLDMDPSGTERIDDALTAHWTDGTLIEFPTGTYRTARMHEYDEVFLRGLRGLGDSRRDVEFVSPAYGEDGYRDNHLFLVVNDGRDLLLENYTLQQGEEYDGRHSGHVLRLADGLRCRELELAGFDPIENGRGQSDADPSSHSLVVSITDQRGIGVVDHYVRLGSGVGATYPYRRTGALVHDEHVGELRFRNCHFAESGSHSIYGSHHLGCVRIDGGSFVNNDNTNIRISGGAHPTKRSWVRDATVVIDTDNAQHLPEWSEGYENTKGLEIESTLFPHTDLLVENVGVHCYSTPESQGLIRVHHHGSVTFRDVQVENTVDGVPPFVSYSPYFDSTIRLENVRIHNQGSLDHEDVAHEAVVYLRDRHESEITGCCVRSSGEGEDGVLLDRSMDVTITDTTIDVPGEPVSADSGSVEDLVSELELHDRHCTEEE